MARRAERHAQQLAEEHRRKQEEERRFEEMKAKREKHMHAKNRKAMLRLVDRNIGNWRCRWGLFKAAIGEGAAQQDVVFYPHMRRFRKHGSKFPESYQGVIMAFDTKSPIYTPGAVKYQFCPSDGVNAETVVSKLKQTFAARGIEFEARPVNRNDPWGRTSFPECTHVFKFTKTHTDADQEFAAYANRVFGTYPKRGAEARGKYVRYLRSC
jgi:hypothetical protein